MFNLKPFTAIVRIKYYLCRFSSTMTNINQYKVFITRPVPGKAMELLKRSCEVSQWIKDIPISRQEFLSNAAGKDALFCLLTDKIDSELLDAAGPKLKVIGTMSVGFDHIDITECKKRGIAIGYTPNVLTDATSELTVALLLTATRRLQEGMKAVKNGTWGPWSPTWLCGGSLAGSCVGIIGLGRIGMGVARRLMPFGVKKILYCGHSEKQEGKDIGALFVDFDELIQESDFVIVTCALTPDTKGLLNKDVFSKMKSTAVLVNTSRGSIVNQDDLYEALKNGQIRCAGLDVTTPEPLPPSHALLELDNCVVLPHIGSATELTRIEMSELTARNILAALEGKEMPFQVQ